MKNSILYKVYLKRVMPLVAIFSLLIYIMSGNQDVFESNWDTLFFAFAVAMTGVSMFFMIRTPKDYDFVNALPVTKGKQWISMYGAAMTVVGIVYIQYIVYTCIRCYQGQNLYGEVIMSGVVKCLTTGFVMTLMMWIYSHTDFRFSPKVLIGILLIIGGSFFAGEFIQKAFDLKCNNFACELINRWHLMTVPYKVINLDLDYYYVDICGRFTLTDKVTTLLIYLVIILALTAVLAFFTYKNYCEMDLAKDKKKGNIKNFNKVLVAVFTSLAIMSGISMAGKIVENSNVSIEHYWSYGENCIGAHVDGDLFYRGDKLTYYSGEMTFFISKYNVDFPKVYQYGFIGAVVVSLGAGCAVAILGNRKNEVAE